MDAREGSIMIHRVRIQNFRCLPCCSALTVRRFCCSTISTTVSTHWPRSSWSKSIEQILQANPDLQVLATAHSPYLLNYLRPEQVRLMAVGDDGYARCGRLTDHPKFDTWKEEMAPGEMWSLFGEKWVAEKELGGLIGHVS